jgi:acetyl esterase/lipase
MLVDGEVHEGEKIDEDALKTHIRAAGGAERVRRETNKRNEAALTALFALLALLLSIWIIVPGPVLALFVLSVGGTELWPVLTALDGIALLTALYSRGRLRPWSIGMAAAALACTLVPPAAYLAHGPHVPLSALLHVSAKRSGAHTARSNAPVVLAIYGGAWERGSPKNDAQFNAIVASWGYHVIALDYPHAPQARWPAQRDAILRQIDAMHARHIVLLGHSSGAQLAMITGALRPARVDAIITYESPVDLAQAYEHPSQPDIIRIRSIVRALCGGSPRERPACYRSASPRYVVHSGMPPVLMIAAGRDHVVTPEGEHLLRDELRNDGVPVTYVELPWADHAFEMVPTGFDNRIALWYLRRFLASVH